MASDARSFERTTLAARVPAYRAPCPPITEPTLAVRDQRPPGIASSFLAMARGQAIATLARVMPQPKRPQLKVEERAAEGSRAVRRLRREGFVPGVVYGGEDCTPFKVGARELRHALHEGSAVLDL